MAGGKQIRLSHRFNPDAVPMAAFAADQIAFDNFAKGSRVLLDSLRRGYGPLGFIWRSSGSPSTWQPQGEIAERLIAIRAKETLAETLRTSRDPCFRCGTRGDVGCEHRRVA